MPNVRRLTEIVLLFYRDTLGLKVMAQPDARGAVFLQVGERQEGVPQQLVLVPLRPPARRRSRKSDRGGRYSTWASRYRVASSSATESG
jgi:hypothetical protein